jgi:hypothetical protein
MPMSFLFLKFSNKFSEIFVMEIDAVWKKIVKSRMKVVLNALFNCALQWKPYWNFFFLIEYYPTFVKVERRALSKWKLFIICGYETKRPSRIRKSEYGVHYFDDAKLHFYFELQILSLQKIIFFFFIPCTRLFLDELGDY